MTADRVVIVGAGGFGREVLDVIEAAQRAGAPWEFVGFVDDGSPDLELLAARGAPLLAGFDDPALGDAGFVLGIGDPAIKRKVDGVASGYGLAPVSLVHPSATFGAGVEIGPGAVVCSQVAVTTNVRVGRHVQLNLGVTVGHDCVIGDYVSAFPNVSISGSVNLGEGVTIGTGAVIIQGVTVGAGTTIGAGAVVTRDLPPDVVAVGAPAKPR